MLSHEASSAPPFSLKKKKKFLKTPTYTSELASRAEEDEKWLLCCCGLLHLGVVCCFALGGLSGLDGLLTVAN